MNKAGIEGTIWGMMGVNMTHLYTYVLVLDSYSLFLKGDDLNTIGNRNHHCVNIPLWLLHILSWIRPYYTGTSRRLAA